MNILKTTILLAGLTGLLLGIGYFLGGQNGVLIALALSFLINFISYWFSDKIVLSLYRAKEVSKKEDKEIHLLVEELAAEANILKPRIYFIPLAAPNAFATGRNDKHAAVAVTEGILNILDKEELRAVLAHEISHIKNRDILISSIAATIAGAVSYLAQLAYYTSIFSGRGDGGDKGKNPFTLITLLILTPIIAVILQLAISRSREYLADEEGSRISRDPGSLATALKKLHQYSKEHPLIGKPRHEATAHLFIVNPFKPSLLMRLFSTHPPVNERVKRLQEMKIG